MNALLGDLRWQRRLLFFACSAAYVPYAVLVLFFASAAMPSLLAWGAVLLSVGGASNALLLRLERVRARKRECEARYERAAQSAHDGLVEWELPDRSVYFSARFCEMLGYAPHELVGDVETWCSLVHPDDREAFKAALIAHRERLLPRLDHEHRLLAKDGSPLWVHVRGVVTHTDGADVLTAWATDISARKQAEQALRFHAFRDALTGLPNRNLFMDRLEQALLRAQERHGRVAVLLIDLDRFKRVNDSMGHPTGDGLLLTVAERLKTCVRAEDTVARLGGDEFALLLEQVEGEDDALQVATRVREALLEPVLLKGRPVTCGSSIGIVVTDAKRESASDVLRDADTALYRGKALGRNQYTIFHGSMRESAVERLTLESELRRALQSDELEVLYQPIVDGAGTFCGFEALPRWHNPRLGLLMPKDFIGLAEETNLIMELGDFVLQKACEVGRQVRDVIGERDFTVHINLSPKQIRRSDLVARMDAIIRDVGFDAARLCVEVTEDLVLEQLPSGNRTFEKLREKGIKLCMDDFGTGYSSLSYLHRFRVDYLKIETAFVHGAELRESGAQIVRSLINLARNLGVTAIAEGVESERQWSLLRTLGCPRAQGFFIARPLSADDLVLWVSQRNAACA